MIPERKILIIALAFPIVLDRRLRDTINIFVDIIKIVLKNKDKCACRKVNFKRDRKFYNKISLPRRTVSLKTNHCTDVSSL